MLPRGGLQRPDAVWILLAKLGRHLTQHCVIVARFVATHAFPIKSLRCCLSIWKTIKHGRVSPFGVRPVFTHERNARQAELQLRTKLVAGQITFDPMTFSSIRIEYEYGGRPVRVETMEISRMLFDVGFERYEVFVDEGRRYVVGV